MNMITNPALLPKVRSQALKDAAEGQPCSLRLPGICCHDNSTVVLAHLPGIGKSMGSKVSDLHGAFACHTCHTAIDTHSYAKRGLTPAMVLDAMLRGLAETQARWVQMGLLHADGMEVI